jgi:ubiquinone/menaquinone biosynthesis C-methylase UbiE
MERQRVRHSPPRRSRRERETYLPFGNKEWRNAIQSSIEVPMLARALRIPARLRVLEIGCGRGVGLVALAEVCEPALLVGLDVDQALLGVARQRIARRGVAADLVHADARRMPFADASFDVIVDFGTCYHLPRPRAALGEISRVLSAGGLFVHETRISQLLAHPIRSLGNRLPWEDVPDLTLRRHAGLWASRAKRDAPIPIGY